MLLPPVLVEKVIFSVASVCVCVSVCTLQAEPLGLMDLTFYTHIKDQHISEEFEGQRS